ncbi:cell division protein FtsL [Caldicoprobacter guelmensis]|uniref:septum formation initiator family protein n=1 Tax=Caldicoprobacter guelmensis TaxID=1170224 RepID=UPI0019588242|nr:cell division protein FtsL [Caldicoprobacter guelmensis]MBM7583311.1 cell division protein FtsL [Caldicoprobacter guelmensis]
MVVAPKRQHYAEPLPKSRTEVKSRPKAKPRPKRASRIKPIILVALWFVMAFLVVSRHAAIAENHQRILELEKRLDEALKQSELLKLELAASEDLRRIEEVARNQLHMNYPHQTQVQYVELPENEMEQKQAEVAKHQETSIWDIILRLID